jgi:hypothetical protein
MSTLPLAPAHGAGAFRNFKPPSVALESRRLSSRTRHRHSNDRARLARAERFAVEPGAADGRSARSPHRQAFIRTRRGAAFAARCRLGSDPDGR